MESDLTGVCAFMTMENRRVASGAAREYLIVSQ